MSSDSTQIVSAGCSSPGACFALKRHASHCPLHPQRWEGPPPENIQIVAYPPTTSIDLFRSTLEPLLPGSHVERFHEFHHEKTGMKGFVATTSGLEPINTDYVEPESDEMLDQPVTSWHGTHASRIYSIVSSGLIMRGPRGLHGVHGVFSVEDPAEAVRYTCPYRGFHFLFRLTVAARKLLQMYSGAAVLVSKECWVEITGIAGIRQETIPHNIATNLSHFMHLDTDLSLAELREWAPARIGHQPCFKLWDRLPLAFYHKIGWAKPCLTPGCKFVATWRQGHCCNRCASGTIIDPSDPMCHGRYCDCFSRE